MLVSRLIPPPPHCSFDTNSFSLNTNTGSLSLLGLKIAIDCMLVKALLVVAKWDVKDVCYKKPVEQECFRIRLLFLRVPLNNAEQSAQTQGSDVQLTLPLTQIENILFYPTEWLN